MKNVITGTNIIKIFGKGEEKNKVLDDVNITMEQSGFTAVMGPSGCGKSTLLFALSGMDNIDSGSVKFGEEELSGLSENVLADFRRARMGFVFQQATMLKNLNLMDNIVLPAMQEERNNVSGITQKAKKLMEKTGIAGLEEREIAEVSGGQLQRAGICRALMNTPDIIFADEPTGALNSKSTDEIMELLSNINREGTAILLVTHDAKVAARADRVLFMKDGRIVAELKLGKYSTNDLETRTEKIVQQMTVIDI
jgi:putative ABC transport system ATP-binding protein